MKTESGKKYELGELKGKQRFRSSFPFGDDLTQTFSCGTSLVNICSTEGGVLLVDEQIKRVLRHMA